MRDFETLPPWAARQRSRRLTRHASDKIVRWINPRPMVRDQAADSAPSEAGARPVPPASHEGNNRVH